MKLARQLGYANPDKMLDEMTSEHIAEWEVYNQIDPIGEERADLRTGIVCSVITNIVYALYGKKGQNEQAKPADFMPKWHDYDEHQEVQSKGAMRRVLKTIASVFGKKKKKKNK